MNIKRFIILNILSIFILTGCKNTKDINYNSDIKVNGPSLKISLIQTAYEIYTTNIENLSNNSTYEDLYNNTSRDAKKHYKWLTKTYNSMDDDMKFKLKNIFDSNSSWSYTNSVINLDDNASVSDIVDTLVSSENLSLSSFYYSLNPISSQSFEFDNNIVSTIQPNTSVKDLLRVPFHKYSHSLFDSFTDTPEFLDICNELESDDELVSVYNEYGRDAYHFNEWCEENLIEGFSKYLDYRYSQYEYDFSNFVYDLDFYNYLRKINFNPDKVNLKDVCIDFYTLCLES